MNKTHLNQLKRLLKELKRLQRGRDFKRLTSSKTSQRLEKLTDKTMGHYDGDEFNYTDCNLVFELERLTSDLWNIGTTARNAVHALEETITKESKKK